MTVTLAGTNDRGGSVSAVATTAADGSYSFGNLRPGTYTISETQPAAYLDGDETVGSLGGTVGNDIFTLGLAGGQNGSGYNFGEIAPASLGGAVLSGATPIAGVTITLAGTDDRGGQVSTTTTTAANGSFSFGNLRPGTYTISETQPAGWLDGDETVGSLGGMASNDAFALTLAAGAAGTGYNFGEIAPASLAGTVVSDLAPISGVAITLAGTDDRGGSVSATATTAADGSYKFDGLRPGSYTINETQPAGLLDGNDSVGNLGGTAGNDVLTVNVLAGAKGIGYNFTELRPASLAGAVYLDSNNNGQQDAGETGIPGVTVTLAGTDDRGGSVSVTAVTNAAGGYNFGGLRPGNYTINEMQPAAYLDGLDSAGTLGGTAGNDSIALSLAAGAAGTKYNFGEINPSSLSGFAWQDYNNDGLIDFNEMAVPGMTVVLVGTDDRNNPISLMDTTDSDGMYFFGNLRPGQYTIKKILPVGYADGKAILGTVGGSVVNGAFANIALETDVDGINYNFGLSPQGGAAVGSSQTATIGFWHNKNGQALLTSLNGSATSTQLGNWLATTFPNIYGLSAGAANMTGKTNDQVASYYLNQVFSAKKLAGETGAAKVDAQVMAVAFATYVTDSTLAGTVATKYGFRVTTQGVGVATFNVGSSGAAFGVANGTVMTVLNMLLDTNSMSSGGQIYNLNIALRNLANTVYTAINEASDIG